MIYVIRKSKFEMVFNGFSTLLSKSELIKLKKDRNLIVDYVFKLHYIASCSIFFVCSWLLTLDYFADGIKCFTPGVQESKSLKILKVTQKIHFDKISRVVEPLLLDSRNIHSS